MKTLGMFALLAAGCAAPRVEASAPMPTHFVGGVETRGHAFVEERTVNDRVVRHVALASGYASHVRVVETGGRLYVAIVQDEASGSTISLREFDRALHVVGERELVGSGEPSLAADEAYVAITVTQSGPATSTHVHVFESAHLEELGEIPVGAVHEYGSQLVAIRSDQLYVASVPATETSRNVDGTTALPPLSVFAFALPSLRATSRVQTELDAHEACELRATTDGIALRGSDLRLVLTR